MGILGGKHVITKFFVNIEVYSVLVDLSVFVLYMIDDPKCEYFNSAFVFSFDKNIFPARWGFCQDSVQQLEKQKILCEHIADKP